MKRLFSLISDFYHQRPTGTVWSLLGASVFWLVIFFLAPLVVVVVYSLARRGVYGGVVWDFGWWNYLQSFDPLYLTIYWRSFWIALLTTGICLLVSYPVAYYLALKVNPKWKQTLLVLAVVPFWTSFLIRTYAWVVVLRSEGVINTWLTGWGLIDAPLKLLYSDVAVLLGQVYGELPFMILPLYATIERLDTRLLEAAMDLGANRFWAFVKVTLPLTKVGIMTGVVLVFIPSLGAFITPDLLGGAKSMMVGNLIQNQFIQRNQPFGSAVSVLLMLVVLALLWIGLRAGMKTQEAG
jgi:spermidine/putrescine transport system permease protein